MYTVSVRTQSQASLTVNPLTPARFAEPSPASSHRAAWSRAGETMRRDWVTEVVGWAVLAAFAVVLGITFGSFCGLVN